MSFPLDKPTLEGVLDSLNITDLSTATIRQCSDIARTCETEKGLEFVHLEMGIPGMAPEEIGVKAECEALRNGVASIYPHMLGIEPLKRESSRFIKAFLDTDISPASCVPTVGSMQGSFAVFMLCSAMDPAKDTVLFIDPGFPVQRTQADILGIKSESFDIYSYRADKLQDKVESYLSKGNICAVIYSNPNNPAWICLTEEELRIIGELANKYDTLVIEDLAYMCMDFRKPLGKPFEAPYQPTVSRYTDNYVLLMSASKIFSYAGQRVAIAAFSDKVFNRRYEGLEKKFGKPMVGDAFGLIIVYAISAGVSHSAQYALTAMFKAAADGELDFVGNASEYGRRASVSKEMFLRHGFRIVYDKDIDEEVSDGFFYTVGYGDMTGPELMAALIRYGVCAIPLNTTGSRQNGLRICVSQMNREKDFTELDRRLGLFAAENKI